MTYTKLALNEKVAVVIGGTSGIGRACAQGYAEAGARAVIASSRRQEEVEKTAGELESAGVKTLRVAVDVTSKDSLQKLCDAVVQKFGRVDVMLNAAGRTKKVPSLELSEEDW